MKHAVNGITTRVLHARVATRSFRCAKVGISAGHMCKNLLPLHYLNRDLQGTYTYRAGSHKHLNS